MNLSRFQVVPSAKYTFHFPTNTRRHCTCLVWQGLHSFPYAIKSLPLIHHGCGILESCPYVRPKQTADKSTALFHTFRSTIIREPDLTPHQIGVNVWRLTHSKNFPFKQTMTYTTKKEILRLSTTPFSVNANNIVYDNLKLAIVKPDLLDVWNDLQIWYRHRLLMV